MAESQPTVAMRRLHPERDVDLPLPRYMSPGAAGCDLVAALVEPLVLQPLARAAVPTGLAMAIPAGFEGQIRARSGHALRRGLAVLNAPGTIDSDYRGELRVILANLSAEPVTIVRGARIAQLVIAPVVRAVLVLAEELDATDRSENGFGSTGG